MPPSDRLAAFVFIVAALIVVPGPSVLFVVSRGVALGRRAALATAAGNAAGVLAQVVAVALGLGSIVERSVLVFSVLKFAGALYLIHLGVQTWRHRKDLTVSAADAHAEDDGDRAGNGHPTRRPSPTRKILREGFIVGASNPKGLLIFTAVLPQFVTPAAGSVPTQLLTLGLICVLIALISDSAWGLLAGTARTWLSGSPRRLSAFGGASSAVMVGLGLRLACSSRP